jgi:glycosyltransferase involved in cell wall biosynthesis
LNILQVTPAYKPAFIYGGPTMSVSMLAEQLAKTGATTEVYATTANGKVELDVESAKPIMVDGVNVTYFKRITKDHTHFSPQLLLKLWRECRQFDVIHVHGWWNTVSVLACLVAQKRNMPVIVSPRGMLSNYTFNNRNNSSKSLIHRFLGRRLLTKSYIHVTSQNEYEAVLSLVKPKGIFNIPNFIKLTSAKRNQEPIAVGVLKLLFFSRIEQKKGLDILLDALRYVTIPYHLTIAGTGKQAYIDQLKAKAKSYGISDKIDWIGFQTENKFNILANHDVMVLPSYDENFGNVVIESLSVGTPVLISDQVGLANYVKQNDLGWICETNATSISNAINDIALHTDRLKQINKIAPGRIKADFDETVLAEQYTGMYKTILQQQTK